jgi:hypothetical protein
MPPSSRTTLPTSLHVRLSACPFTLFFSSLSPSRKTSYLTTAHRRSQGRPRLARAHPAHGQAADGRGVARRHVSCRGNLERGEGAVMHAWDSLHVERARGCVFNLVGTCSSSACISVGRDTRAVQVRIGTQRLRAKSIPVYFLLAPCSICTRISFFFFQLEISITQCPP